MSGFTHEAPVSESHDWYTPPWVFEMLGLTFDLDPCHPRERLPWVPVYETYSLPDDGLALPWFGKVWLNPPYDPPEKKCHPTKCSKKRCVKRGYHAEKDVPGLVHWMEKMHHHSEGMALVFARTDTEWFHSFTREANGVLFLRDRVQYVGPDGKPKPNAQGDISSPGAGSMLVAWGDECRAALIQATFDNREIGTFADLS